MANVAINRVTSVTSSEVRDGNNVFSLARNSKGNLVVTNRKNTLSIPAGEAGVALANEILALLGGSVEVKAKRTRRTKAEIEAAKAAEEVTE